MPRLPRLPECLRVRLAALARVGGGLISLAKGLHHAGHRPALWHKLGGQAGKRFVLLAKGWRHACHGSRGTRPQHWPKLVPCKGPQVHARPWRQLSGCPQLGHARLCGQPSALLAHWLLGVCMGPGTSQFSPCCKTKALGACLATVALQGGHRPGGCWGRVGCAWVPPLGAHCACTYMGPWAART